MFCAFLTVPVTAQDAARDRARAMADRAFEGAQWVMATQAARAVAQMGARAAAGDGPLGDLIRQRQQLETALEQAHKAFEADEATARQQIAGYEQEIAILGQQIRDRFPNYAEFAQPRPLGYDGLRAELRPGEALVLFLSAPQATYVWAVSRDSDIWHRADLPADELAAQIRDLRAGLDPTGPARAAVALNAPDQADTGFDLVTAHRLYRALIAPVMPVLAGADHVFVVKDGALSSLPLAVLPTQPANDVTEARWLIERFALTTLPGVSSLRSIRAGGSGKRLRVSGFLGFGDPDFRGDGGDAVTSASRSIGEFFDESGTRVEAIRRLAPLPGTARELRRIARLFPDGQARILLGASATESAVRSSDLEGVSILSFATHGLITGDISGLAEPALALSPPDVASSDDDGLLTASEASQLKLNADWVILSACNTAAGDGTPGAEGLSGLARAFLFAGARSILVSHWPVRDDVAARLTSDTLSRLRDTPWLGRSEALRRAVLALMADRRDATLAHPAAWAPFVIVGEGGVLDQ